MEFEIKAYQSELTKIGEVENVSSKGTDADLVCCDCGEEFILCKEYNMMAQYRGHDISVIRGFLEITK